MRYLVLGAMALALLGTAAHAQLGREAWRANVILALTDPVEGTKWTVERIGLLQWNSKELCEQQKGSVAVESRFITPLVNAGTWKTASGEPPTIELQELVCTEIR